MSGAKFQTYLGLVDDGRPLCEVRMLTAADIPASVDLSPPLPTDKNRQLARWPDGVLAVVSIGAGPHALQVAYREGLILRELTRMQFEAELAIAGHLLGDALLASAPAGGTA